MYLEKMTKKEIGNLCERLTLREMHNLSIIFDDYRKLTNEEELSRLFGEEYEEYLGNSVFYSVDIDEKLLDIYEFKTLLNRFKFKELYIFTKIVKFLFKAINSEYYKNLYTLSNHLFNDYAEFIISYKNLDNMSKEELEYYLNNISTSALDNYCMCVNSENEEPTVDEMYNYFHDREIKGKRLIR